MTTARRDAVFLSSLVTKSIAIRLDPVLPSAPMKFARSYRFWFYAHPKPLAEGLGIA